MQKFSSQFSGVLSILFKSNKLSVLSSLKHLESLKELFNEEFLYFSINIIFNEFFGVKLIFLLIISINKEVDE